MIAVTYDRIVRLMSRRRSAKRLGIEFSRAASFILPNQIVIDGQTRELYLPDENGVRVAFIDLLLDDCYGCRELERPIRTIVDIGANVGLFGVAARIAQPNATVHAYEPNPYLEKYLSKQSASANFQYFMEAVGADNARVSLDYNDDSVLTRSVASDKGSIPQIAFREVISRIGGHVDFLKLDCEGAEWSLFPDSDSWRKIDNLSMEYHLWPNHTVENVRTEMHELGYKIKRQSDFDGYGLLIASRE